MIGPAAAAVVAAAEVRCAVGLADMVIVAAVLAGAVVRTVVRVAGARAADVAADVIRGVADAAAFEAPALDAAAADDTAASEVAAFVGADPSEAGLLELLHAAISANTAAAAGNDR